MEKLRWGILSTGTIARRFAKALTVSTTGTLAAVASRDSAKAEAMAREFSAPQAHGRYEDLLANPNVQAVYIATPHPQHAEWAIRAARAGKHILCEKPVALNYAEAGAMVAAARENGVFFMEAFMYRCHPQTAQIVEILQSRVLGEIHLLQASFGFDAGYRPESRLFANALGGGGILDVGCYCTSMARLIAGVASGKNGPVEPIEIKAIGHCDPQEGTDLFAAALLKFPGGLVAQLSTGLQLTQSNEVQVWGRRGWLTITSPWFAGSPQAKLILHQYATQETREILTATPEDLYTFEIDLVARHLAKGQAPFPAMTPEDTLGNMQTLDAWRQAIGVTYRSENREAMVHPLLSDPIIPEIA